MDALKGTLRYEHNKWYAQVWTQCKARLCMGTIKGYCLGMDTMKGTEGMSSSHKTLQCGDEH